LITVYFGLAGWGYGPRAGRVAAGLGSGVWLTIGLALLGKAFHVLPANSGKMILYRSNCFSLRPQFSLTCFGGARMRSNNSFKPKPLRGSA